MILINALITPDIGLMFWTIVTFLLMLFLLGKFAWKPILSALHQREKSIEEALLNIQKAKDEMEKTRSEYTRLMSETKVEREKILKETNEMRNQIIKEAHHIAKEEGIKILSNARQEIQLQKNNAIREVKNHVVEISLEIAEKVLRKKLSDKKEYEMFSKELLKDINLN